MRINTKILFLIIAVLILAAVTSKSAPTGFDPNIPDTVYIDSIVTSIYFLSSVPIYFYNDEGLGGLEITITHNSPDIVIDSFSFVNGRVENYSLKGSAGLSSNTLTIYCFPLSEGLIPAGTGLLGDIYFSPLPGLVPQIDMLDTVTFSINNQEYATAFSDSLSNIFSPVFVEGYLDIIPGCCIGQRGNIDNSPDNILDIADLVYLVDYMFNGGPSPACNEEANVDGSPDEIVDIADMVYLVDYMFGTGPAPAMCP